MESMGVQLLAGLGAVVGLFAGAALGGLLLVCTPLRRPGEGARRHPRR
jgi:hypothetical protein